MRARKPRTTLLRSVVANDRSHHLHAFSNPKRVETDRPRVIVRARDIYVWDSSGKRYIDGLGGVCCVNVGYGREELATAAYDAMKQLSYAHSFYGQTNIYAAGLAAKLISVLPEGFDKVFFASSGSEANDSAIKLARYYWRLQGRLQKTVIIGRVRSYHGMTLGAASLNDPSSGQEAFGLPLDDFALVSAPDWYWADQQGSASAFGKRVAQELEERIQAIGVDRVAAFIVDPIQIAGGLILPPQSYWPEIQRICRKHRVLIISDEMICGFGRTGNWFGCETLRFTPDLITMAKGLSSAYQPISAVAINKALSEVFVESEKDLAHGFTSSAHPVTTAVALRNIELIKQEKLIEKVRSSTGPQLRERLKELERHPLVGEVRGVGMVQGIILARSIGGGDRGAPVRARVANALADVCIDLGLMVRATGDFLLLSPPLTVTRQQIDEMVTILGAALNQLLGRPALMREAQG